jgi:uncharacterized protein (TIGR03437 family)
VPAPSAQIADRFGIYNWNIDDAAFPNDGSTDRLNWAADRVAQMGTRTIRIALSARDIYQLGFPANADSAQIAQHPAYDKLLRDARFRTVMLTVYSRGAQKNDWSDGFTTEEYNAERDDMRRLGEYLLSNPAFVGKTFITFTWEGDNAIYYHTNKRTAWDDYLNWIKARTEGIKLAKQNRPDSQVRLFSGMEYNRVRSITDQPCGTPVADPVRQNPFINRCLIDYVAPRVEVDYYSYSGWHSLLPLLDAPNFNLKAQLQSDFEFALALVRRLRPEVAAHNFILGEWGFPRTYQGECVTAAAVNTMFDALTAPDFFPLSYAVFWQVVDNVRGFGLPAPHFGLFRAEAGALQQTLLGQTFQKRLAGQAAEIPANCPRVPRPPEPGVLTNGGASDFTLNPDPMLSIFAAGANAFSATGNTVRIGQATRDYVLPRDNPQGWSETSGHINLSLPATRRPGLARLYVTDARGIESNAQDILLTCTDCPHISSPCGLLETEFQTLAIEPGSIIALPGERFAASGNTVVIEQLDKRRQTRTWTRVGAQQLPLESATQIRVKLPADLVPGNDTVLHVINPQGRGSNEVMISIVEACAQCAPRLSPCGALNNPTRGAFQAGGPLVVGGRFVNAGNRVVIEQYDRSERPYRYVLGAGSPGWNETPEQLRLRLPITLFAGRALVYVMDAAGRESRAQEIMIAPHPVTTVSAASFRGPALAPAAIAALFGNAFSAATAQANAAPLPTELAETRAIIKDSAGIERFAPLFFVSPTQINLQIPPDTAEGAATITVQSSFGATATSNVEITKVAPGLFTANANGRGVAAAVVVRVKADGTQIFEPVADFDPQRQEFIPRPIDLSDAREEVILLLFGTGLRARSSLAAVTTTLGGINAEVLYAGAQDGFVGLDQINVRLPRTLAGRGPIELVVTADGKLTVPISISIK